MSIWFAPTSPKYRPVLSAKWSSFHLASTFQKVSVPVTDHPEFLGLELKKLRTLRKTWRYFHPEQLSSLYLAPVPSCSCAAVAFEMVRSGISWMLQIFYCTIGQKTCFQFQPASRHSGGKWWWVRGERLSYCARAWAHHSRARAGRTRVLRSPITLITKSRIAAIFIYEVNHSFQTSECKRLHPKLRNPGCA